MKLLLPLTLLIILSLLPSCASKQRRTVSSIDGDNTSNDIIVVPERIWIKKPSWVRGQMILGMRNEENAASSQRDKEKKIQSVCKCKVVINYSDGGVKDYKLGNGVEIVYSDGTPTQTCEMGNQLEPLASPTNRANTFSWEAYDCVDRN